MKILIYPKSENPYHELLYGPMRSAHPQDTFSYLNASPRNLLLFPFVAAAKRLQGYMVFHLHWHAFYLDKKYKLPFTGLISFVNTIVSLTVLKLLGYKLIWTVHNVLPHEPQTTNDAFVTRYTAKLASHVIVHSSETLKQLQNIGANTSKVTVNPHGNYAGMYSAVDSRAVARKRLGIAPQDRAILFFGNIRPYKGVEQLLEAFKKLGEKNVRLIIAGRCLDDELSKTITTFAKAHPDVTFHNGTVPDKEVAAYFMAADAACMPFTSVTTSGSVLLAATFGKPIVAPYTGAIRDIPKEAGALYDPAKKDALLSALKEVLASQKKRDAMASASAAFSKTLDWDKISAKTYELYR